MEYVIGAVIGSLIVIVSTVVANSCLKTRRLERFSAQIDDD